MSVNSAKATKASDRYWQKLMGQAAVSLAGASKSELRVALYETLEEFFNNSNCWQEAISVPVIPETLDYALYPVAGGRVLRLYGVLDENGSAQAAIMPEPGKLRFLYPYTQGQTMTAVVIKTVTDPLCCYPPYIPDWILPTHGIAISHGLIGSMMLQPGQSYSNPQMANYHLQKFRDGWAHARVAMTKANTVGVQNWAFPQQFRTSSQKGGVSTFNVHPTSTR